MYFLLAPKRTVLRGFPNKGMSNGARTGRIFTHPNDTRIRRTTTDNMYTKNEELNE